MKSSIDEFLIVLDEPARVYSPGDGVHGQIIIKTNQAVKVPKLSLECRGEAYVSWPENCGTYTRYRFQKEEYFTLRGCVYDQETSNQDITEFLESNSYTFSFRATIPRQDLPPSFECQHGFIRYCIFAEILNKSGKTKLKTEQVMFTIGNHEEFDEGELEEIREREKKVINGKDESTVLGSRCYPVASVTFSAHTDKILYCNRNTIKTTVRTDSEMTRGAFEVDVTLVRATKFKDAKGHSMISTDRINSIDKPCVVETAKDYATELTIPNDIYPTLELACKCINVTYYIRVCLRRRNKSRKESTLMIPIIIITTSSSQTLPSSSSSSSSSSGIIDDQSVSKKSKGSIFYLTGSPLGTQSGKASKPPRHIPHYDNLAVSVEEEVVDYKNTTNCTNRQRTESLV